MTTRAVSAGLLRKHNVVRFEGKYWYLMRKPHLEDGDLVLELKQIDWDAKRTIRCAPLSVVERVGD